MRFSFLKKEMQFFPIFIILGSFIGFYFVLISALNQCNKSNSDCRIIQKFVLLTSPSITVDILENQKSLEWSGSVQGVEISSVVDSIRMNQKFILSMMVFPDGIINVIVLWDKRK